MECLLCQKSDNARQNVKEIVESITSEHTQTNKLPIQKNTHSYKYTQTHMSKLMFDTLVTDYTSSIKRKRFLLCILLSKGLKQWMCARVRDACHGTI